MKLSSKIAGTLVLFSVITTASADDKAAPELLVGITDAQIEALSASESAKTRGERIRIPTGVKPGWCGWKPCFKTLYTTVKVKVYRNGNSYYVKH